MQMDSTEADTTASSQPSSAWLAEHACYWPWRSSLLIKGPRSEALRVKSMAGMMLEYCHLVESVPHVVAQVPLPPLADADMAAFAKPSLCESWVASPGMPRVGCCRDAF